MWWSGVPGRRAGILYVDDLADACIHLMKTYSSANWSTSAPAKTSHRRIRPCGRRNRWLYRRDQFRPLAPNGTPRNCSTSAALQTRLARNDAASRGLRLAYEAFRISDSIFGQRFNKINKMLRSLASCIGLKAPDLFLGYLCTRQNKVLTNHFV